MRCKLKARLLGIVGCSGLFMATGPYGWAQAHPAAPPPVQCKTDQLSLTFDDENGAFNGMSQSGVLMVLRNIGAGPCQLPALPLVQLEAAHNQPIPAQRKTPSAPQNTHALTLMPEAEATARLHWVAGDVYDGHHCITPTTLVLSLPDGPLHAPFAQHLCAPVGSVQFFDQAPLRLDTTPPQQSG